MKIALYGATGKIGSRILREALGRGHEVTAIVRDSSRLTETDPALHVVVGDALDPESVASQVVGHDAILSAFGPDPNAPQQLEQVAHLLIEGTRRAGVNRLVVVGGAGSLEVAPGVQLVDTPDFPAGWKAAALAHREGLNILRKDAGDLEWTYFSPAALIQPGERTEKYRLGGDQLVTDEKGDSRISMEDFAKALVDELEHPAHIRQRFTIGY